MNWKIPLFKIYSDEEDVEAVTKVIRGGSFWANGPEVGKFEKELARFSGRKHAITFNSGTSALHAILVAYGVRDKEVIVPSFTFISTANSVILAGGKPVFAEIEEESFSLDPNDVLEKITNKTKAIMPIHYAGMPCKSIKALKDISEDKNILLIEDAAESMGARAYGKLTGTFGDSAMYSFCQNKIVATGEGGAIITDDTNVAEKLKLIRSHGRVECAGKNYFSTSEDMDYIDVGYNYRMPTILAALGSSQLKKINKVISLRRKNAEYYNKALSKHNEIRVPASSKELFNVYQMYTIELENRKQRDALQKHMDEKGVMTKVYFNPVHLKTYYREKHGYKEGDLPKTEEISRKVLTIPMHPNLEKKEMDYVIESVNSFFSED